MLTALDFLQMFDGLVVRVVFLYALSRDARYSLHFLFVQRGAEGGRKACHEDCLTYGGDLAEVMQKKPNLGD